MGMTTKAVAWLLWLLVSFQALAEPGTQKSEIQPLADVPPTGGDFTLQSSQGPISTTQFRGKVVLLYFGYTQCPDVCPTSFSLMAQALNELTALELDKVRGIFVSVDPKRDSVERLAEYVDYFHPSFIGVTGEPDAVAAAARLYGVQYSYTDASDSAMGYIVNHSAVIYLIDQQGELRFAFPHETSPETMLGAIRMLLEER